MCSHSVNIDAAWSFFKKGTSQFTTVTVVPLEGEQDTASWINV